jgi:DNA (cytosine-5)-methyltransferase 1
MTFGSLFVGIGGIDLGLEKAGWQCEWQVEQDPYALKVLEKNRPSVPKYRDVRYFLGSKRWRRCRQAWHVDLICGGFPCQDISNAGKRTGIEGKRSGLWSEFARIIRLLRPDYVFVENVPALTIRGLGTVLGDLAKMGFNAEWGCLPAAAVGAPHARWRLFLVAHRQPHALGIFSDRDAPDAQGKRFNEGSVRIGSTSELASFAAVRVANAPDADSKWKQQSQGSKQKKRGRTGNVCQDNAPESASRWAGQRWRNEFAAFCESQGRLFWPNTESGICGVADGIPNRAHRLKCLGNAVIPSLAEWVGKRILEAQGSSSRAVGY